MAAPVVQSVAHTNGSSNNVVISAPSGIQNGDLLIAAIVAEGGSIATPSGWTSLLGGAQQKVFWKLAASESGSYTFTCGAAAGIGGYILRINGNDGGTPINASNSGSGGSASSYSITGITTTVDACLLIQTIFALTSRTITSGPAVANNNPSWTNNINADDGNAEAIEYDGVFTTAGATGNATGTFSGATAWVVGIIAIAPVQPSKNTGGMLMGMVN